jgi:transposase
VNRQQNINEARSLLADIELGEADIEAKKWRVAELAAEAVADGMSRREYAKAVSKSDSTINTYVRVWDRWGAQVLGRPLFKDAIAQVSTGEEITSREWNRRNAERRMPTQHEDRVAMATKLLADPEVVKAAAKTVLDPATRAGRLLAQAAYDQDADKRRRRREQEEQSRADKALPLPAYMAKMVVQMNEWTLGLAALVDDLDELPDGRGRELVADAARKLAEQAQRWVDRLERKPDLRVIEGKALRDEVAS